MQWRQQHWIRMLTDTGPGSIFNSTSFVSNSAGMMRDFAIREPTTLILGMTTYLVGLGCGPMVLAPLSELYGRRVVYLGSLLLYFLLLIPPCVATNFTTILVVRFFGSVPLASLFPSPVPSLLRLSPLRSFSPQSPLFRPGPLFLGPVPLPRPLSLSLRLC